ncbi:MAG: hypothetical protein CMJ25_09775 [Phycisphaerae bacterium]|nr:hypothetical protein [Phycisphaerae bacterium]
MPSTYTTNNGIELIATGEQSGTWGDTTNTNLSLLDTSLDGQVSITLAATGSSGSPNFLPINNGATSNGRNRLVIFADGGDLGGTAFVQLTPNDAEKIIYIRNNLSGSRSILVFQGTYNASNDYEVPAGTTAVVYFDGGGTGAVAANVFNNAYFDSLRLGSVSVTAVLDEDNMSSDSATALATQQSIKAYVDSQVGTVDTLAEILANGNTTGGTDIAVSAADDITFADNSKAIFGAGSDLQIYHNGANSYIDDTGTGNLYIRGSDTVRLQSATGEQGVIVTTDGAVTLYHDNGSKLATTATGIDVTGTVVSDGLTVDTDTLAVDSTNNRVGIGTSSPSRNLHVSSTGSPTVRIQDADGSDYYAEIQQSTGNTIFSTRYGTSNGAFIFRGLGGGTADEYMRINTSGNVGIGTTSPAATIDVSGNARGAVVTDNDLSFDLSAGNNFSCTPTGGGTLTFTNHLAGQSGFVWLDNSGGHAIAAAGTTKINAADLTAISTAGVYTLSYFDNGTNAYVSVSRSFA